MYGYFFSSIDKLIKRREIESSEVSLLFLAKSTQVYTTLSEETAHLTIYYGRVG